MLRPLTANEKPSTPSTPKQMIGKNMDVDDKRVEEETRVIVGALVWMQVDQEFAAEAGRATERQSVVQVHR